VPQTLQSLPAEQRKTPHEICHPDLRLIFCNAIANGQNTLQKTKACGISHDKNPTQDFSGVNEVHERDKTMDTISVFILPAKIFV
jgi:hypothetical protein